MTPKRQAIENARRRLEQDQKCIRSKIRSNRYDMRILVEQQTTLKRELAVLGDLLRALAPKTA